MMYVYLQVLQERGRAGNVEEGEKRRRLHAVEEGRREVSGRFKTGARQHHRKLGGTPKAESHWQL
jgi:hypothetical protein